MAGAPAVLRWLPASTAGARAVPSCDRRLRVPVCRLFSKVSLGRHLFYIRCWRGGEAHSQVQHGPDSCGHVARSISPAQGLVWRWTQCLASRKTGKQCSLAPAVRIWWDVGEAIATAAERPGQEHRAQRRKASEAPGGTGPAPRSAGPGFIGSAGLSGWDSATHHENRLGPSGAFPGRRPCKRPGSGQGLQGSDAAWPPWL